MSRRLLFVLPDLGAGGAHFMNVRLAHQLQQRGWSVSLAVLFDRPEAVPPGLLDGLPIVRLRARGTLGKIAAIARLGTWAKNFDLVIGGMEFAATNYGYLAARWAGRPFVSWTHTAFDRHQAATSVFDRGISRWIYRRCAEVVFPSAGARESLRLAIGTMPARARWHVVENFISVPTATPQPPNAAIYALPVLIGVGRLVELKAFDRLIRAHAALRTQGLDHHLVILGDGPQRPQLDAEIERLGVRESVFLPGHVTNVHDWLAHASVFALCSRYEGFALALAEALAAGVATVAMDCPSGPSEVLQDGRAGRLVPADDEAALTAAIGDLLRDPALRARYAALGRVRALDYTPERIVPRWEALLTEILARGKTAHD
jgi:glycosyltransferase involved in cell wall biosynthesis